MCRILKRIKNFIDSIPQGKNVFKLTRIDDSIDEDFPRYQAVVVLVHLAEQICEAGLLVVHELQELLVLERKKRQNQANNRTSENGNWMKFPNGFHRLLNILGRPSCIDVK